MTRNTIALLTALGVDNFGSGLFLPVVLLYVTRVVGLPLAVLWCAASLAALAIPPGWRPAELLAATLPLAAAGLLFGCRANALAETTAPGPVRGRYLAAFQYGFTVPGVIAPAVAALFSVAVWLPWLLAGLSAGLAVLVLGWLAGRLPAAALRPAAAGAGTLDRVA
jgi:hypothetical protein